MRGGLNRPHGEPLARQFAKFGWGGTLTLPHRLDEPLHLVVATQLLVLRRRRHSARQFRSHAQQSQRCFVGREILTERPRGDSCELLLENAAYVFRRMLQPGESSGGSVPHGRKILGVSPGQNRERAGADLRRYREDFAP